MPSLQNFSVFCLILSSGTILSWCAEVVLQAVVGVKVWRSWHGSANHRIDQAVGFPLRLLLGIWGIINRPLHDTSGLSPGRGRCVRSLSTNERFILGQSRSYFSLQQHEATELKLAARQNRDLQFNYFDGFQKSMARPDLRGLVSAWGRWQGSISSPRRKSPRMKPPKVIRFLTQQG